MGSSAALCPECGGKGYVARLRNEPPRVYEATPCACRKTKRPEGRSINATGGESLSGFPLGRDLLNALKLLGRAVGVGLVREHRQVSPSGFALAVLALARLVDRLGRPPASADGAYDVEHLEPPTRGTLTGGIFA